MPVAGVAAGFDWSKCIFCQKIRTNYRSNCPDDSKRKDVGSSSKSHADAVESYLLLGQLPAEVRPFIVHWNEDDEIEATCTRRHALEYVKCRQLILHSTIQGWLSQCNVSATDFTDDYTSDVKRCSDNLDPSSTRVLRSSLDQSHNLTASVCFFL
jgi:hypothetical protein